MAAGTDRNSRSEYGGGPGRIQRYPDGSSKPLTPREEAVVLRARAFQTIEGDLPLNEADDTPAQKIARQRLSDTTNGYSREV